MLLVDDILFSPVKGINWIFKKIQNGYADNGGLVASPHPPLLHPYFFDVKTSITV